MQFWIMDALKQSVVRYTHRNINEDKKNVVVRYRSLIQLYVNNFGLYVNNGCTKKICGQIHNKKHQQKIERALWREKIPKKFNNSQPLK